MTSDKNYQWRLARRPIGNIQDGDLVWHQESIPSPNDGEVLVRTIYLSLDPTNRIWMSDMDQYMPPVKINEVMRGGAMGEVLKTKHPGYKVGDIVTGLLGWQAYSTVHGDNIRMSIPTRKGTPLPAWMSVLGLTGVTAYFGMLDICKPRRGETLVVTGAGGAVGSIAGQIGKIKGLRVVGVSGTDAKCLWLKEKCGFDATINYKSADVGSALRANCPEGIDCVFENVGGNVFDEILGQINLKARVALCGLIAQYNATEVVPGPYRFANVLMKRARVEGFIVSDFAKRWGEAIKELSTWLAEGKLTYKVDIVDGLCNAPVAVKKLFDGSNDGKLLVRVAAEP